MTHAPAVTAAPTDDTPVDERAPYADPPRWPWLAMLAAVALAVLAGVAVVALLVRAVWRRWRRGDRTEVIMIPSTFTSGATGAPVYRVEFYDDRYRQLADVPLAVELPALYGPAADGVLAALARDCKAAVERRDSQRCFDPVIELYDEAGRLARTYRAGAA